MPEFGLHIRQELGVIGRLELGSVQRAGRYSGLPSWPISTVTETAEPYLKQSARSEHRQLMRVVVMDIGDTRRRQNS